MAFSPVSWAFKDQITSAKLAQMVENTLVHDHREDGTQGDPFGHLTSPTWTQAQFAIGAGATVAAGSVNVPTVKRGATLFVSGYFSPSGATAGLLSLSVGTNDSRLIILSPASVYRWPLAANVNPHFFVVAIPVAAGSDPDATTFSIGSTTAGQARVATWVQG